MKKVPRAAASVVEASPHKSVAEELETLRKTFRAVSQRYAEHIEQEIVALREKVLATATAQADGKAVPAAKSVQGDGAASTGSGPHTRDLRDMLMLLRSAQFKPDAHRRKELKKIESLIEDLRQLTERWT